MSLALQPTSAVTRSIYVATTAAFAVVATLSLTIGRSAVNEAVAQLLNQQLAMVPTAAVAIEGEITSQAVFGENASHLIELIV